MVLQGRTMSEYLIPGAHIYVRQQSKRYQLTICLGDFIRILFDKPWKIRTCDRNRQYPTILYNIYQYLIVSIVQYLTISENYDNKQSLL